MDVVDATTLKNQLGAVLERAMLGPVAIKRHGRIVAHLVPVRSPSNDRRARAPRVRWDRATEERAVELAAARDLRPSRWLRAGDSRLLAGIAMILGSHDAFDRTRALALAERLQPGISSPSGFDGWLRSTPVAAERFLRLLDARLRERAVAT
ncbi:MAG: hypothetical protein ABW071_07835 [Casimicrobiaceae bacterium]